MEVHINNIDKDLYITFDSAMNILDEIQRLRKEKKYDLCFINHLKKDIERMGKTIDTLIDIDTEHMDRIDKARELINEMLERAYTDGKYIMYDYSTNEILEIKNILNGDE